MGDAVQPAGAPSCLQRPTASGVCSALESLHMSRRGKVLHFAPQHSRPAPPLSPPQVYVGKASLELHASTADELRTLACKEDHTINHSLSMTWAHAMIQTYSYHICVTGKLYHAAVCSGGNWHMQGDESLQDHTWQKNTKASHADLRAGHLWAGKHSARSVFLLAQLI